ncbi:MAG: oligopeptidase B, partial [Planctomycetota bacterium]
MHPIPSAVVASLALAVPLAMTQAQDSPNPPVAKRVPHVQEWHGAKFEDPWFWLRQKDSPDVRAYLEAENAYTKAM